jgi:hypothetical protein
VYEERKFQLCTLTNMQLKHRSLPITSNETLDLSLSQLKNREIESLTVHYRTVFRVECKNNIDSKLFLPKLVNSLVIYIAFP